jgi:hypothetical protein
MIFGRWSCASGRGSWRFERSSRSTSSATSQAKGWAANSSRRSGFPAFLESWMNAREPNSAARSPQLVRRGRERRRLVVFRPWPATSAPPPGGPRRSREEAGRGERGLFDREVLGVPPRVSFRTFGGGLGAGPAIRQFGDTGDGERKAVDVPLGGDARLVPALWSCRGSAVLQRG